MNDTPPTPSREAIEHITRNLKTGETLGNRLIDQFERDGVSPEEGCAAMAFVTASVLHHAETNDERQAVAGMLSSAINFYLTRFEEDDEGTGVPTPGPLPENIQ